LKADSGKSRFFNRTPPLHDRGDSVVKVDADGTGGVYSFVQIATLDNITGLTDEAALESAGTLITA
jgi:hypothetical protein